MDDVHPTDSNKFVPTAARAIRLFRGCLSVRDTPDGLRPLRFTDAQLAFYAKTDMFRIRSLCPAGIRIDALTDSRFIELDYTIGAQVRDWANFDILLNGAFVASIPSSFPPGAEGRLRWDLPDGSTGPCRISVYLPQCADVAIGRISFSEGANVREAPAGRGSLLCLGDSITQGMDARHPSCTYAVLLARYLGFDLLNQGVGGFVFDSDSLDPELDLKPDLVTVAYGTNDWSKSPSPETFARDASAYLDKLTSIFPAARIAVLSPIWRKDLEEMKAAGTFRSIGETIERLCARYPSVRFIDGMELVPHQERFFGDGKVHPTDEGFAHFALNLAARL